MREDGETCQDGQGGPQDGSREDGSQEEGAREEAASRAAARSNAAFGEERWVFAYGSLMWNPGFDFAERCEARLIGAHRALCVYSFHHRGTPEAPGLVLGLERGGSCRGIAYRVPAPAWVETHAYLTAREQISGVYHECVRRIQILDGSRRRAPALAYLVNRGHAQYAGGLTLEDQLHLVRRSHGRSGANADYVIQTVGALETLGLADPQLSWIAHHLRGPEEKRPEEEL